MRAARTLGIALSEFDEWADDDRAWVLALDQVEQDTKRATCPHCGDTTGACQDPTYQRAWDMDVQVCYRTKTAMEYMQSHHRDDKMAGRLVLRTRPSQDPSRIRRTKNRTSIQGG